MHHLERWFRQSAPRVVAGADLSAVLRKSSSSAIRLLLAGATGAAARMAAERAAGEARVRFQALNLQAVATRYLAETERNLGAVFTAAARAGAVLLFEEADALFDSSDGSAIAPPLLKRLDVHRLPVLFSLAGAPRALDAAFVRRMHYIVDLRPPDAKQRDSTWRSVLPG
jgi:SpoVK/Ycf46/Vps4 family AAA+-type ATPase